MLPILWRASAVDDLDEIVDYIVRRNVTAARSLREKIESSVLPLSDHLRIMTRTRPPAVLGAVAGEGSGVGRAPVGCPPALTSGGGPHQALCVGASRPATPDSASPAKTAPAAATMAA